MNNEYLDTLNKLARKRQLALTKEQEKAIIKVYEDATAKYYEKFLDGMGNGTKSNGVKLQYCREMGAKLQKLVKEYSYQGAENGIAIAKDIMNSCYDEYGLGDTDYAKAVNNICRTIVDESARRIIQGEIYKDGKGLSQRIWNTVNNNCEAINEVVASCMAQQLSAVEMSKVLQSFMNPNWKGTDWDRAKIKDLLGPGYAAWNKNLSYEALRLARTTITHSATLAMKESAKANPYLNKAIWHSVHAIGRTCSQCKERDGQVYSISKLPFDHPNGLCWNEPVLDVSLDDMANELSDWVQGQPNEKLDTWWRNYGKYYSGNTPKAPVRDEEWVNAHFGNMKDQLQLHWDYGVKDRILNSPEFMQDWLAKNQHLFNYGGDNGDGSYYSPSKKQIYMNLVDDVKNSRGMYSTLFHEFGHQMDFEVKGDKTLSNSMKFYNAIEKDYNDTLEKFGKGTKPWPFVKGKIIDAQRADGDFGSGVQDMYSGLSSSQIVAGWCHSKAYWTRNNTKMEIASESWAHMHSAYTNPQRLEVMKKWFPTACEVFEDIVKSLMKG